MKSLQKLLFDCPIFSIFHSGLIYYGIFHDDYVGFGPLGSYLIQNANFFHKLRTLCQCHITNLVKNDAKYTKNRTPCVHIAMSVRLWNFKDGGS